MTAWWNDQNNRDRASYALVVAIFSFFSAGVRLLRESPEHTWARLIGDYLAAALGGFVAAGLVWKFTVPDDIGYLVVAVVTGTWAGPRLLDKLTDKALKRVK